jgi:hypothetical protein
MLSPQKAGWGVKTGYFFAGTAALGGVIMFFLMPEVRYKCLCVFAGVR